VKRDLRINFGVIKDISDDTGDFQNALGTIKNAIDATDALLEKSSGKAVDALKKSKDSLTKMIKEQRAEVSDLHSIFNGYYCEMTKIIPPTALHSVSIVDRNDIWANLRSIDSAVETLYNQNQYLDMTDFTWGATEDEKEKWARNYRKLNEAQDYYIRQAKIIKDLKNDLWDYYNQKVVAYENTDDAFAEKANGLYDKYTSSAEGTRDLELNKGRIAWDFIKGIGISVWDFGKGIWNLNKDAYTFAGAGIVWCFSKVFGKDVPAWAQDAFDSTQGSIAAILKDPRLILEGLGQKLSDMVDQRGIAYTIGYLTPYIAAALTGNGEAEGAEGTEGVDELAAGAGEGAEATVEDILDGATPGRATMGPTTQYVKPGDFEQAAKDFDSLKPSNVKPIDTKWGPGETGTLPDGRAITVRPGSSDTRPTLEIRNLNGRRIEIRYGNK